MNHIKFQHGDAWIFMTIPLNGEGIDLEGIIAWADAINHAIPADEEIEGALTRGLCAGILKIESNRMHFTERYHREFERIWNTKKGLYKIWDEVEEFLTGRKWEKIHDMQYKLKKNESREAYERYSAKFRKAHKGIGRNDK